MNICRLSAAMALFLLAPSVVAEPSLSPTSPKGDGSAEPSSPRGPDTLATDWNSPGMFGAGLAVGVVGAAGVGTGLFLLLQRESCAAAPPEAFAGPGACATAGSMRGVLGVTALALGGAQLATSVPLMIAGAWRVEVDDEVEAAMPDVAVGLGAVDLRWRF